MPKINAKPAGNYMLKVNNGNTRTRCGRCLKLATKTPDLMSLLLTLNISHTNVLVFLLLTISM